MKLMLCLLLAASSSLYGMQRAALRNTLNAKLKSLTIVAKIMGNNASVARRVKLVDILTELSRDADRAGFNDISWRADKKALKISSSIIEEQE